MKKQDLAERLYQRLFRQKKRGLNETPLAITYRIWPDPKPEILAAIRAEIEADRGGKKK